MKKRGYLWFVTGVLSLVVIGVLQFQETGAAQPKPTGSIIVLNRLPRLNQEGTKENIVYALVTLFRDGEQVRSKEIDNFNGSARWSDLPTGPYEIHFEVHGYGKVVKKVVVSSDDYADVVLSSISKNDEVWGGGPTLFELQKRIQTLEDEVATLKKGR